MDIAVNSTLGYTKRSLLFVVVLGGLPTVLSNTTNALFGMSGIIWTQLTADLN